MLAQYNLSGMVASGRGCLRDPVRAHMWMLLAASGGDTAACASVGADRLRLPTQQLARAADLASAWQQARRPA